MQAYDEFLDTLIRYFEDPENEALSSEVSTWRKLNNENELYYQQIYKIWIFSENAKPLNILSPEQSTKKFTLKLDKHTFSPKSASNWWFTGMAATILLVLSFSIYSYFSNRLVYITKTTENSADSVLLSDGSKIYLNAQTSIKYPKEFKSKKREILLTKGTAFFDIERDTTKPFTILMDASSVKVLGTSFTITKTEAHIKLGVKTGTVLFTPSATLKPYVLDAGNGINYQIKSEKLTPYNAKNSNEDAWLTKELVFVDAPLADVVEELEVQYGKKIQMQGDFKKLGKFNAKFKNASLEEIFEVIEQTYPITHSRIDSIYSLHINK